MRPRSNGLHDTKLLTCCDLVPEAKRPKHTTGVNGKYSNLLGLRNDIAVRHEFQRQGSTCVLLHPAFVNFPSMIARNGGAFLWRCDLPVNNSCSNLLKTFYNCFDVARRTNRCGSHASINIHTMGILT